MAKKGISILLCALMLLGLLPAAALAEGEITTTTVSFQISKANDANGTVSYRFGDTGEFTTADLDNEGNASVPVPQGATTITVKAVPGTGFAVNQDRSGVFTNGSKTTDFDFDALTGDGFTYNLTAATPQFQIEFDNTSGSGGNQGVNPNDIRFNISGSGSVTYQLGSGEFTEAPNNDLNFGDNTSIVIKIVPENDGTVTNFDVLADGQSIYENDGDRDAAKAAALSENGVTVSGLVKTTGYEVVVGFSGGGPSGDTLSIGLAGSNSVSGGTFAYDHGTARVMFVRGENGEGAYDGSEDQIALGDDVTAVKIILTAADGYQGVLRTGGNNPPVPDPEVNENNSSESTYTFARSAMEAVGNFVAFTIEFTGEGGSGGNDPEPDWYTVSWGGGNVTVENGTVLAERVHLGDKTFTVNAEESGASESDKIFPIGDIIGQQGQEGLGVYGLGYSDTDLFIGNEVAESVSIDFKFVPNYGYQLSDILTNESDSLLRDFTASASEISTFNFPVRQGGNVHFNVVFAAAPDTIDTTGSTKVSGATIENGGNATDSGNLKMTIADLAESAVSNELKAKAGESALYLDMNLYQVVSKAGQEGQEEEENWKTQIESFENPITVTLRVPKPADGKSYYIIREHGNETKTYSRIAVAFVPDGDTGYGTVTFETDKFSNYALAQAADNVNTDKDLTGVTSSKVTDAAIDTNYAWVDALPAENASATEVKLTVADSTPGETTKSALASKAGGNVDPAKSFYLDLTMTASDGTNTTPITELRQPVAVTLTVPEISASEKYVVVRQHNTTYEKLPCTYDRATSTLTVQSDKFSTYAIFVIPAYAATEISSVTVNVTAPTADLTVGETAVTVDPAAPYFVHEIEWSIVANKGSTESLDWVYGDDRFEAGKWYLAEITLYADFRYEFADSVTPAVSGSALATAESEGDTLTVCAWFPVGGATDTRPPISTVEVTNAALTVGQSVYDVENTIEENATTGDGYFIDNVDIHKWVEDDDYNDYSYWDWTTSGSIEADTAYGIELTLLAKTGYAFANTIAATINGRSAEVASRTADELVLFLPSEQNVTITKVEVKSATWPIHGNTIDKSPENFYFDNYSFEHLAYTLESAEFQISTDGGTSYNPLTALDTTFDTAKKYRVQAVLKAKDGATFASSVTGDFNGDGGVDCVVSSDRKTCTVTRTCAVYDAVYSYKDSASSTYVNGVTIHVQEPAAGETYSLGSFGTTSDPGYLWGASASAAWYEVPYVGSTGDIKRLSSSDTFESGKVYRLDVQLENWNDYRFADGFAVSFKTHDGNPGNYAMMSVTTDTARKKSYSVWYTVGAVADPQPVTFISIQGPALQEDGTVGTDSPSAFTVVSGNAVINSVSCYNGSLMIFLVPASGCYFGRSVTVNYNIGTRNILADVTIPGNSFLSPYESVRAEVDLCIPVEWSGIKVKDKVYDGTANGELDLSAVTLTGVAEGDVVQLECQYSYVMFEDAAVGDNKHVDVFGYLTLTGAHAWKYRLANPYLQDSLTASITDAPPAPIIPVTPVIPVPPEEPEEQPCDGGDSCPTHVFADVDTSLWYHEYIDYVVEKGMMGSMGGGQFQPGANLNRAMLMTMLARLDGEDTTGGAIWYTKGMDWAMASGISDGTNPENSITREQMVTMLYRYAKLKGYDVSVGEDTNILSYNDALSISEYAIPAMQWAVGAGLIEGRGNAMLVPTGTAMRSEVAAVMMRFCENVAK